MLNLKNAFLLTLVSVFIVACSDKVAPQADNVPQEEVSEVVSGLFYDDDGQNCVLFVSDPKAGAVDEKAARRLILEHVKSESFEVCDDRPRPRSVGLYAVSGLDEYDQPDWANSTEHYFFKIKGWSKLKKLCNVSGVSEECLTALDVVLIPNT